MRPGCGTSRVPPFIWCLPPCRKRKTQKAGKNLQRIASGWGVCYGWVLFAVAALFCQCATWRSWLINVKIVGHVAAQCLWVLCVRSFSVFLSRCSHSYLENPFSLHSFGRVTLLFRWQFLCAVVCTPTHTHTSILILLLPSMAFISVQFSSAPGAILMQLLIITDHISNLTALHMEIAQSENRSHCMLGIFHDFN